MNKAWRLLLIFNGGTVGPQVNGGAGRHTPFQFFQTFRIT